MTMRPSRLPDRDLVLLGMGHTNAHVLRQWMMQPLSGARLTCISDFFSAAYSGMLPGVLAGQYEPERMAIDLVRLCARSAARLIVGHVSEVDVEQRRILFSDRPAIHFDVLSIGIGSVPDRTQAEITGDGCLDIKPMQTFLDRLRTAIAGWPARRPRMRPLHIAVVGGGVGGVEIACCLPGLLQRDFPDCDYELRLLHAGAELLEHSSPALRARVQACLVGRGVKIALKSQVVQVDEERITTDSGESFAADLVIWAASAVAGPLLSRCGLPTDDRGFLLTDRTLRVRSGAPVFAVGDSGTIVDEPVAKAGVYAVREGPVLWDNVQRLLGNQPLREYRPQKRFLKLINCGDGTAVGEYRGFSFAGRWVWRLKDRIDSRFIAMFQPVTTMENATAGVDDSAPAMKCLACGGKLSGGVLKRVLDSLAIPDSPRLPAGLRIRDDAAILDLGAAAKHVLTTDFFAVPFDDPWLAGRIAAVHALNDVFAMGGEPVAAVANVTVPEGSAAQQERLLTELLAGGAHELERAGAVLAGGHSLEGPRLEVGYAVVGESRDAPLFLKSQGRAGDLILLTKPLGSGVLLAAHMRGACRAAWWQELVPSLLTSNAEPSRAAREAGVRCATDVSGFGLAGHLLEILEASASDAELYTGDLPLLSGASELLRSGLRSTLSASNERQTADGLQGEPSQSPPPILFDPQTCGGLLLIAAPQSLELLQSAFRTRGLPVPHLLGRLTAATSTQPRLRLRSGVFSPGRSAGAGSERARGV